MDGEFELIARIRERLGAPRERSAEAARIALGSGDDAAVTVPGGATATSVDMLVEGVHFRRETAPLRSVGHKALATALSDLAAMGALAGEAYVQLGLPEPVVADDALELADGLAELARIHGVAVLGGDISRAAALTLAVTVVGHAASPEELVTRGGAAPGELVCVTGELGGAAAGLLLLERPELGEAIEPAVADELRARQLTPQPRLAEGQALAAAGASAMIDVSDGVGGDAAHLAVSSGVAVELEADALPLMAGVREVAAAAGIEPLELACGGEDYELLAALDPAALGAAAQRVAAPLTRVGRVRPGSGARIRRPDGRASDAAGFDQLRARPRAGPAPS